MYNHLSAPMLAILLMMEPALAQTFHRVPGSQIRGTVAGMEMTDTVHWADVFEPNGILTTYAMSKKTAGTWRVQKDELCIERGKDDGGCYQVWIAGKKIELRREGSKLPLEGVLRKATARK